MWVLACLILWALSVVVMLALHYAGVRERENLWLSAAGGLGFLLAIGALHALYQRIRYGRSSAADRTRTERRARRPRRRAPP